MLGMNGKGQFLMNLAITLTFGLYGVVGALTSELLKPEFERNGAYLAILLTFGLMLLSAAATLLGQAYTNIRDDNHESRD
jgi:hypothetical protein